jgi:chromosome segregation ATPase
MAITAEDVIFAAEKIQAEGSNPTIEKIRFMLGAGSNSTISKHLKDWRDSRPLVKSSVTSPPDQVQAAVSAVWEKLNQETQATIEAVKAEAQEQVAAARQETEAAQAARLALKDEHEALKNQYNALSAQKELLALDYKQAETNQQLLRERLEALTSRHQEIQSLHAQEVKRLEEKYLSEIARLQAQTQQEVQLARQLADTLKSHYEDARVDSMRQVDQLRVENQKSLDVIKRLEVDNANLQQAVVGKDALLQQVTAQLGEAQRLIQTQQAQWDTWQDKRFVTDEIVAVFRALPAQVTNELSLRLSEEVKKMLEQATEMWQSNLKELEYA